MGLLDRITGGGNDNEQEEESDIELDGDIDDVEFNDGPEEETEEEEEEVIEEFSSAYDYAFDVVEQDGHASMKDFIEKCMYIKCRNSSMYRDRISNGVETIDAITTSVESIKRIRGGDKDDSDWGDLADDLEDANRVIDGVEKLNGQEDMIVREGMGLAKDALEAFGRRATEGDSSGISSSMNDIDDEL